MKIIAMTHIKGGVGKTTTAVNLAYLSASGGFRTCLWDLDPQGAATHLLRCDNGAGEATQPLADNEDLSERLMDSPYAGLQVLPADRASDALSPERRSPAERLLRMRRALRDIFPVLLIDCPAGFSPLSDQVLRAADALVVPLVPSPLSLRMLELLDEFAAAQDWGDLQVLPFFSMVDRRRALHRDLVAATRERHPAMLKTEVPYSSDVERMSARRAPLTAYAPASSTGFAYRALWAEIRGRSGLKLPPLWRVTAPTTA